ncbi:hypothetical protein V2J56_09150 [Georgenia sp. MJ206]|uniref:hypothetical protein n=1 Tax=Georgenia wangjunii TaxID=3117730 RepID=UPI002F2631F7
MYRSITSPGHPSFRPLLRFVTDDAGGGGGGGTGTGDQGSTGGNGTGSGSGSGASGTSGSGDRGDGGDKTDDAEKNPALAAERARAKAAEERADEAERKLQAVEDAKLSDLERAQREATEARTTAEQATTRALRYEVAAEAGIPLDLASRLVGTTREALLADAEKLKPLLAPGKTSLKPDRSQGAGGSGDGKNKGSVSAGADLYAERHKSRSKQ